jgi:hypothetical protein
MIRNRFILEQLSTNDLNYADLQFFETLDNMTYLNSNSNIFDKNFYYDNLRKYIAYIKETSSALSVGGRNILNKNISKINEIFKQTNELSSTLDPILYVSIKDDLSNVWKGVYPSAVVAPSGTGTSAPAVAASEPDQETLNAAFAKYMGSSYNPNSPMDKGKMETVKNALKKFQEENNKPFDINDSEDLTKMRPVMNAAYQSEEYKKVAGVSTRGVGGGQAAATSNQQTPAQRKATSPASPKGGPTYYIRSGFNRYVPAVEADITSGQQLFMQNPNRAARMLYPYVKVDSRSVRRATPAR